MLKQGDGGDHYPFSKVLSKWDYVGADVVGMSVTYSRFGVGQGFRVAAGFATIGQAALGKNLPAANASWGYFGHAFKFTTLPSSGYYLAHAVYDIASSGGMKLCTLIGADGTLNVAYITVSNFSTTVTILATSAAGLVAAGTWYYVESGFKINATVGGCIVKLNGAQVGDAAYLSYTGNTVRSSGSNFHADSSTQQFTHVRIGGSTFSNTHFCDIDDWYYCDDVSDGVSPPTNTFLGPVRLGLLQMIGDGDLDTLTPVGVADTWDAVNDAAAPDDLTTYVYGSAPATESNWEMEDMSLQAATVFGLLMNARVAQDDAAAHTYNTRVKNPGGSAATVATRSSPAGATFVNQQDVIAINPDTGARYTPQEVNDLLPGLRIAS